LVSLGPDVAVPFLEHTNQLVFLTRNPFDIVLGELAPLGSDITLEFLPLA
jgi:hypothetical protein